MTSTSVSSKCIKRILSDLKNIDSKLLADNKWAGFFIEGNKKRYEDCKMLECQILPGVVSRECHRATHIQCVWRYPNPLGKRYREEQ